MPRDSGYPRLSLQVTRVTKSPMGKISTASPYTSTCWGSRTDWSTERTYRHYWLSRRTCCLLQGICLRVHWRSVHWGGPSPCPCKTHAQDKGGGVHRDGRAAPTGVDHRAQLTLSQENWTPDFWFQYIEIFGPPDNLFQFCWNIWTPGTNISEIFGPPGTKISEILDLLEIFYPPII